MKKFIGSPWIIGVLVAAAVSFGLIKTSAMTATEAITLCALIYGTIALNARLHDGFDMAWPKKESETRDGARDEVSQLAWLLFGRDAKVSFGGMKHIRETAQSVFNSVGVDLNQPEHESYLSSSLGPRIVRALTVPEQSLSQPELKKLIRFLENIESQLASKPLPTVTAVTLGEKA